MSSSSYRFPESSPSEYKQRIAIPIQRFSPNMNSNFNEQYSENAIYSKDTTTQWIKDSNNDREKFRMKINIEGFDKNDVHCRVEGTRLFVYGERIENKSQGTSRKVIEKSYELPTDVDKSNPHVSFPSPVTMQVDFPSKRSSTRFTHSSGYTSPRKVYSTDTYDHKTILNPRTQSPDNEFFHENRNTSIPIQRISIISKGSSLTPIHPNNEAYKSPEPTDNPIIDKNANIYKKIVKKVHRRLATPTVGVQSSQDTHHHHHHHSVRPVLSSIMEEDHTVLSSSSSSSSITNSIISNNDSSSFPPGFDSNVFYQSEFQPQIFTDDRNQRYIDMKLDVLDYKPTDLTVSINDNDLIIQGINTNFYKQITLPSNTDLPSLTLEYRRDQKLYITAKLLDEYSSFKYI
ncbi:unnamed protein product [Adineta steineri]|uniref:SHSP domain-containing protein n=1 Tax=Adineta steineri TaxID=433720 RepID=A0A815IC80_9BILA|nr:unnamed protein product [Adineta steineri]